MLLVIHIILCVLLVGVVLLQAGKSGGLTTTFSGGSQSLFGASGAGNILTKTTTALAVLFFVTSIFLTISVARENSQSVLKGHQVETSTPTGDETIEKAPTETESTPNTPKSE